MTKGELIEALEGVPDDACVILQTEEIDDTPFTTTLEYVEYPRDVLLLGKCVVLQ